MLFLDRALRTCAAQSSSYRCNSTWPVTTQRRLTLVACVAMVLLPAIEARSEVTVFLDFNNNWISNLDAATSPLGFTFDSTQRTTIETNIAASIDQVYSAYDVNVVTSQPTSGSYHRINYGANTSGTSYGSAPLDWRNQNANQTQSVFAANFGGFIETGDSTPQRIAEISASLAGTGAHELGHSLGLRHHVAYGDPLVRQAIDLTGSTFGIQNSHIMATGSTGLGESQRESPRTFSPWANVLLEAANGLTAAPLAMQSELGDAGNLATGAQSVGLTALPISGLSAGLVQGKLSNELDIDFFSFDASAGSYLTAEVWSDDLFTTSDQFDSVLTLYDTDGTTVLFSNDNIEYSGSNLYNGTFREYDSFLAMIELVNTGTHYLSVASVGNRGGPAGGNYNLVFAVPEPGSWVLFTMAAVGFGVVARRRKS